MIGFGAGKAGRRGYNVERGKKVRLSGDGEEKVRGDCGGVRAWER